MEPHLVAGRGGTAKCCSASSTYLSSWSDGWQNRHLKAHRVHWWIRGWGTVLIGWHVDWCWWICGWWNRRSFVWLIQRRIRGGELFGWIHWLRSKAACSTVASTSWLAWDHCCLVHTISGRPGCCGCRTTRGRTARRHEPRCLTARGHHVPASTVATAVGRPRITWVQRCSFAGPAMML